MPNFSSAFTSEVFRPITTLIIPGAIGISTWFLALLWSFANVRSLVAENHTETGFVLLLAMIFAGLMFEDAGSHWESWLDGRADKKNNVHILQWHEYLRTAFKADPIGRRYLRTLVLKLKFELGVAFSMLSAILGLVWLAYLGLPLKIVFISGGVCAGFAAWCLFEACQTHNVLGSIRAELLKEIRIIGS
jgi:hypothetical protein